MGGVFGIRAGAGGQRIAAVHARVDPPLALHHEAPHVALRHEAEAPHVALSHEAKEPPRVREQDLGDRERDLGDRERDDR